MVTGSAQSVMLIGLLIGLTAVGVLVGVGLDFVVGNQGWWGVLGLAGLMTGASIDAVLIEGRRSVRAARPERLVETRRR